MSRFSRPQAVEAPIQISGYIITETLKAILVDVRMIGEREIPEHLQKQIWLPLSQVPKTLRQSHISEEKDILHVSAWIWGQKLQDTWNGKDPSLSSPPSPTDLEYGVEDDDPFYEDEAPPF